ncbi:hypothetical protein LT85_4176 [Collimonas arenae]|uniref:Uncharacterized protein n=1 Tax=Collimonas arenae TaxID=279058 RepID=A0A0A1FI77_9BURK|nr:hypothetical protein LT85_4176 [Collimonas arenae]
MSKTGGGAGGACNQCQYSCTDERAFHELIILMRSHRKKQPCKAF